MFLKSKKLIGMLLVVIIVIAAFLLYYLHAFNDKPEGKGQADQEETMNKEEDNPITDYTRLDSVLKEVPEFYTSFLDETESGYLTELLDYIDINKGSMTQETADSYAMQIEEILKASFSLTEVPQVYIKTDSGNYIHSEYSPASIVIVDSKDGKNEDIIDSTAEIKIRGNSSTEVAKKTYTIKFSKKYDVLGMGKAKKYVLIANAFDKSLMRNKLVFDFAAAIGIKYTPDSSYADVWLNGKFIGNYLLTEVIEASPSRVDINTDKGDFLIEKEVERVSAGTTYFTTPIFGYRFGVNEPDDITQEQLEVLKSFMEKVERALRDEDWKSFTSYVDEKSFIDFYILSELFKTVDFDYSSTRFYIKNGKLYAGPPWDNDLSSGNADMDFYYDYNYHEVYGPDSSYRGLWCNMNFYGYCYEFPEFKTALSARYNELQEEIKNLYEDNSLGKNRIDLLLEKYGKSFERNYTTAGWTLNKEFMLERNPMTPYEPNVEYLRFWLKRRNEFLLDSFK